MGLGIQAAFLGKLALEFDLPQFVVPIPMLVQAAIEPPRNTGPIEMLVSGLLLAPQHPMPRTRNLDWCPLAE